MKNLLLIVFALLFIGLTSCSVSDAETTANQFHEKLDANEFEFIVENLADLEGETKEGWHAFLELVDSWGEQTNRQKQMGFSQKTINEVTTVKLSYTFEVPEIGKVYERLVLVEREGKYKILTAMMNSDEAIVENGTQNF